MFTKPSRREFIATSAALSVSTVVPSALAQTAKWPTKQIRIVVAFPPGGLTDAYARMYAEQLTAKFGVPAVVENKPGAGAIIGIDNVVKSAGRWLQFADDHLRHRLAKPCALHQAAVQLRQRLGADCLLPLWPFGGGYFRENSR